MRLLVAEDHPDLAHWLVDWLTRMGYVVDHFARGDEADTALATSRYDLVILDLSLPGLDGIEVLRRLRERGNITPVLVLTARGTKNERVLGLNLGADDYVPKPFELDELEARIKALLRRAGGQTPQQRLGQLVFDTVNRRVLWGESALKLTPRELALFEALAVRVGHPIAREVLFDRMFAFDSDARIESIEIYVHRLRKKLEGSGVTVSTLWGLGYALTVSTPAGDPGGAGSYESHA